MAPRRDGRPNSPRKPSTARNTRQDWTPLLRAELVHLHLNVFRCHWSIISHRIGRSAVACRIRFHREMREQGYMTLPQVAARRYARLREEAMLAAFERMTVAGTMAVGNLLNPM
ncbi:uncharacterized protein LTR77_008609 [Saxophila tyrrhenica]|uniref:Myb-like domain-containing protein n=1 Tax=Saxophila tyrrhenica TaxID=1690608 RepID=A0AAV9P0K5_9PEZI|nr:hypothetical protein LTR77_008609 [Saxophila tyrrhenica]